MAAMALGWGLVAGGAGMLGVLIATLLRPSHWTIALGMAFGCGVLLAVAAFELFDEAFNYAGFWPAAFGFLAGSGLFSLGLGWLDRRGAGQRRRSAVDQIAARDTASMVALGTVFDGIPKALIIGVSFYTGEGVGLAAVIAVFLANVPESVASATRMRTMRRRRSYMVGVWCAVAAVTGAAALVGYLLLGDVGPAGRAFIQAFAGGAFIISIVDGMIPAAFHEARDVAGLMTALGFLTGYALSHFVG